jgi:hypothetical protein
VSPCVYIRTGAVDPGFALAHELGHSFGMSPGTSIGNEVLDKTGHSADPANLMEAKSGGGSDLTDEQVEIIRTGARRRASNTERGGARRTPSTAAGWTTPAMSRVPTSI